MIPTDQIYCECPQPFVTFSFMSFWGVKNKKHQNSYSCGIDLRQGIQLAKGPENHSRITSLPFPTDYMVPLQDSKI